MLLASKKLAITKFVRPLLKQTGAICYPCLSVLGYALHYFYQKEQFVLQF